MQMNCRRWFWPGSKLKTNRKADPNEEEDFNEGTPSPSQV